VMLPIYGTALVVRYSGIREEEGVGVEGARWQMHSLALRLKMFALVHGQAASSATEAVALRAELAAVADFAIQLALVLRAICRVERFVAKTALEARFVPFQSTGNPLFCSINGFATFRALWMFHGLERHFYTLIDRSRARKRKKQIERRRKREKGEFD
jgi:hypothetical protein